MTTSDPGFRERYGPWALVAGASDGVGAEFADALGERGVDVVLLARRQDALDAVADRIRTDTGVEARAVRVDLSEADAVARITDATDGLDIGMFMYCVGADPNYQRFLANPVETALALVRRNCIVPMSLCHHFAAPMVERGHGGIVLVSSAAGLAGGRNMVAYGASKAFDMVMAEALWAELHDSGVDILGLVLGVTDTPSLRRLLASRGVLAEAEGTEPIPGATTLEDTVAEVLENLTNGPTWFVGEQLREQARLMASMERADLVRVMLGAGGGIMGPDPEA